MKIEFGVEGTADLVKKTEAHAVLIATGARSILPEIPGIRKGDIATAPEVLLGRRRAGNRSVIIGGGLVRIQRLTVA